MAQQETFKALVLTQENGATIAAIRRLTVDDLPPEDVLVAVEYSSLNYKDGLALTGRSNIVRTYPMVPGVDLAGTVLESKSPDYHPGDTVILNGWSVGERYWGGYTQRARVKSEWLIPVPAGMDTRKAMAIGTAGYTAMLCVMTLEEAGVVPASGPVLVTGAAGGVGSNAVAILAKLGYAVSALTAPGQEGARDFLRQLGAKEFVGGPEWSERPKPLETQKWSGAVDTVGSTVLARVLAEMNYGGCVANCGLAGGYDLPATVMPFILRGVSLRGVDSVLCPLPRRKAAWERLVRDLPDAAVSQINRVIGLDDILRYAEEILAGQDSGTLHRRCQCLRGCHGTRVV